VKTSPQQYILGLGSNLGIREDNLAKALKDIGLIRNTHVLAVSPAVDSDPVGYADQPNFLNLCCLISSELNGIELIQQTLAIEARLGRVRTGEKNGPRCIDIDLLFQSEGSIDSPTLTLPHPRWSSRNFVIIPLRQLLQTPLLASAPQWDWLRAEVAALPQSSDGLRAWNGPTPWNHQAPR
jgi:2-amino-4-hydroxy-6-hydroxymethyldihydropteridine diphosphokinase